MLEMNTQAKIFLAVLIVLATLLNACNGKKKREEERKVNERISFTNTGHALIIQDAKGAKDAAGKIRELIGENPPNPPLIIAHVKSIEDASDRIRETAVQADKLSTQTKEDLEKERRERKRAERDSNKPFRNTLAGLIVVGLVAGAVGIALLFAVPGLLGKGIVAGGWTLALSAVALRASDFWIYVFCGGLCVIGLAWIAYKLFTRERKLRKTREALVDVGEAVKQTDKELPDAPVKALVVSKVDPDTKKLLGLSATGGTIDEADISPPPGDTPET